MLSQLGGRKFLIALVCVITTTILCWNKHISDGVYSAVVIATIGAYITGNVAQKATSKPQ
jgi:hypothetical protein